MYDFAKVPKAIGPSNHGLKPEPLSQDKTYFFMSYFSDILEN
jgi:hypothetical protein